VAKRLKQGRRAADTVARLGGDEFLVLLGDLADTKAATTAVENVLATLQRPMAIAGGNVTPSASIGVSLYPNHGDDAEALICRADVAMYGAKSTGRGGYRFASRGEVGESSAAERS